MTNTGNSPLSNVTVTDTNGQSFGPVSLAIGASQTFTYDTTVNANTTNTATARGEDELGGTVGPVSDSATATPIRAIPSVPDLSLWGGVACALLLSALMVWIIRRRLIPRKET